MSKCVYCGKDYDSHKGVTLIKNDGTINYLCSSKCRKNQKLKRRKVNWIPGKRKLITPKKRKPKSKVKRKSKKK